MGTILSVFAAFFMLLNFVGGIGAIVWLAVLGAWSTIGMGVLAIVASTFLIGLALMPSMIFVLPAVALAERGRTFAAALVGLPSLLWTYAVMAVWCIGSFIYFTPSRGALLPYLLLAYAVATAPWSYMATKEMQSDSNSYSVMTAFFSQLGCAILIAYCLFFDRDPSIQTLGTVYGIPMAVCLLIQLFIMAVTAAVPSPNDRY